MVVRERKKLRSLYTGNVKRAPEAFRIRYTAESQEGSIGDRDRFITLCFFNTPKTARSIVGPQNRNISILFRLFLKHRIDTHCLGDDDELCIS